MLRRVLNEPKCSQNVGAPLPNAGEGLGVRATASALINCTILFATLLMTTAFAGVAEERKSSEPMSPKPVKQPVEFSHKRHAELGLECKVCHPLADGEALLGPAAGTAVGGAPAVGDRQFEGGPRRGERLAPEVAILRGVGNASKSVWVDIRTTQQVVAVGFRTVLQQASGPLEITLDAPAAGGEPDVVLYDVINLNDGDDSDLDHLLKNTVSTVIAIDRTLKPELGTRAKDKGVEWAITLDVTPEDLIEVIGDAVSGHLEDCPVVCVPWYRSM